MVMANKETGGSFTLKQLKNFDYFFTLTAPLIGGGVLTKIAEGNKIGAVVAGIGAAGNVMYMANRHRMFGEAAAAVGLGGVAAENGFTGSGLVVAASAAALAVSNALRARRES